MPPQHLLLAAALALVLAALPRAAGHGFMALPVARNVIHSSFYNRTAAETAKIPESYWCVWVVREDLGGHAAAQRWLPNASCRSPRRRNYCPHCLAAGGPGQVSQNGLVTWPIGFAGFCGDMFYLADGATPDSKRDHEAGGRFATGGWVDGWMERRRAVGRWEASRGCQRLCTAA